jgi:hypothetical protein
MKNKTIERPPKEGSQKWIEVNSVNASNKSSKRTSKKVSKEEKPSKIKLVATSNDILKKNLINVREKRNLMNTIALVLILFKNFYFLDYNFQFI